MSRIICFALLLALLPAAPAGAQEELARALSRMAPVMGKPVEYPRESKRSTYQIARAHGISAFAIRRANAYRPAPLPLLLPTQHIAPLREAEGLVINLPEHAVYLYLERRPAKVFPIAIGRKGFETPTGSFRVINKAKNPTWFPPKWAKEEEPVPPGPENPLGDRWMGLSAPGIGLHATTSPASVGRNASHGCMRMYPEHAHELYPEVKRGMPAEIIYQLVSIGYDAEDSTVYLAHFPNTYERPEHAEEDARRLLEQHGLVSVVDRALVAQILERGEGLAVPVAGSPVKVVVSSAPVEFALGPTPVGDDWLVPVGPLAEAMGASHGISSDGRLVVVQRDEQQITLTADEPAAMLNGEPYLLAAPMRMAAGYPLVPLKAVAAALGASVGWDEETKTILVWDGPRLYRDSGIEIRE